MRRWIAGAAALAALALALAGCGSSQPRTPTSASTTTQGAAAPHTVCTGSQLTLSYAGTEGATGHLELRVAVRNSSQTMCRLRGYPSARLLDGSGRALPLHVGRRDGFFPDTESHPRPVALKPGASAHFGISLITNNEYKGARVCRTAASAMLATPGAGTRWQRVSLRPGPRVTPCGHQVVVSPIHA
ncbi:MAG TPA: DUF4232 domain-containing protein [Solirubrobacteraceae bacterium]|nr:DUF4232 domain-containing protein [Solirubrobacteraceae bacterium]